MLTSWNWMQGSKRAVRLFNTLLTRFLSSTWTFLPNEYVTILTPLTRGQRYLSLFLVTLPLLFGQPCIEFTWLLLCSLFSIMSPLKNIFFARISVSPWSPPHFWERSSPSLLLQGAAGPTSLSSLFSCFVALFLTVSCLDFFRLVFCLSPSFLFKATFGRLCLSWYV